MRQETTRGPIRLVALGATHFAWTIPESSGISGWGSTTHFGVKEAGRENRAPMWQKRPPNCPSRNESGWHLHRYLPQIQAATNSVAPSPRAIRRNQAPHMVLEYGYVCAAIAGSANGRSRGRLHCGVLQGASPHGRLASSSRPESCEGLRRGGGRGRRGCCRGRERLLVARGRRSRRGP